MYLRASRVSDARTLDAALASGVQACAPRRWAGESPGESPAPPKGNTRHNDWAGRWPAPLFQVEDFFHHGEALAGAFVGHWFEQAAHELLPALIDGVAVEFVPGLFEIFDP